MLLRRRRWWTSFNTIGLRCTFKELLLQRSGLLDGYPLLLCGGDFLTRYFQQARPMQADARRFDLAQLTQTTIIAADHDEGGSSGTRLDRL